MREVVIDVCPLMGKWHQLISHGEIQYAPHRVYWTLPETQSQRANVSYLYYLAKHLNSQQVIQAGTACENTPTNNTIDLYPQYPSRRPP